LHSRRPILPATTLNGQYTYSIQPTFNLTPLTFATQPTNLENGKVAQMEGEITAMGTSGSTFTLTLPGEAGTPTIHANSGTAYQGISDFSALQVSTFVDMDGAVQKDGSLLASRIAVLDTDNQDLSILTGPVLQFNTSPPRVIAFGRAQQGYLSTIGEAAIWMPFDFSASSSQISGQIENLQSLPFVASFNAANMVDGQNIYVTTHVSNASGSEPASAMTLMPQMINGTVMGSSQAGSFTDYTVTLASYDLFPNLAVQQGQPTLLTNPSQVEVYVDSNTQKLNATALAVGNTLRFYGLVFNDNGTLRMDCAQVNDGVNLTPQSNATSDLEIGKAQIVRRAGPGGLQQTTTVITRSRQTQP
jgi:Domain of unknown function (DUF5666)